MNDAFERLLQAELSISQRIDELSVESRSLHNVIVLYTSLKAELRSLHHLINDTKQLAYEQDSKSEEQALLTKLEWHTNEYKVLQDRLCKANLQANANVAKQLELDRKALLSAGPVALQRDVLRTAEAVTESLERTLSRLITEVERSGAALGTLNESSSVIDDTIDEHKVLGSETKIAGNILHLLSRRDLRDALKIFAAALFYFGVVAYLLKVRVLS